MDRRNFLKIIAVICLAPFSLAKPKVNDVDGPPTLHIPTGLCSLDRSASRPCLDDVNGCGKC